MQLKTRGSKRPTVTDPEALALAALAFLAADPERLGVFLAETGLGPENVRTAASNPGFMPAVLDHLIGKEADLVAFAAEQGIDPSEVVTARDRMPGAHRDR